MSATPSFECSACGYRAPKWLGRCPECGAWGTLDEASASPPAREAAPGPPPLPFPDLPRAEGRRTSTGIAELDRVLGGGLVPGMAVLVGGEPGIGKSTLLLQSAAAMASPGRRILYATAEESAAQIGLRGDRLGVGPSELLVLPETDVDAVVARAREARVAALIVDSVQAVRCADLAGAPGSVAQVREAAARMVAFAKSTGTPVWVVGHVTKDGAIAGPRLLEHMVDTVLQFEGDRHLAHRVLRSLKNRFGPSDELAVFRMSESGLAPVENPSEIFLAERPVGAPGSAVLAALEGTRPLLVEIQSLVGEPIQGSPRRTAQGIDGTRLAMILAVLERRASFPLSSREVYVNVAGGLRVDEPAADLAVAVAAASSYLGRALPERWVFVGEIGLTGEVRSVGRLDARLREALRLGFDAALVPSAAAGASPSKGFRILPVDDLAGALRLLFDGAGPRP